MKSRQVTEWEGERLSDVDYAFNFRPHFDCYCTSAENQDRICEERIALLHRIDDAFKAGKPVRVGVSSDYMRNVIDVGMYDGWPYWKPVPSVFASSPLGGGEWHSIFSIDRADFPSQRDSNP